MADHSIENYNYSDNYDKESEKGSNTDHKNQHQKLEKGIKNVNIASSRTKI